MSNVFDINPILAKNQVAQNVFNQKKEQALVNDKKDQALKQVYNMVAPSKPKSSVVGLVKGFAEKAVLDTKKAELAKAAAPKFEAGSISLPNTTQFSLDEYKKNWEESSQYFKNLYPKHIGGTIEGRGSFEEVPMTTEYGAGADIVWEGLQERPTTTALTMSEGMQMFYTQAAKAFATIPKMAGELPDIQGVTKTDRDYKNDTIYKASQKVLKDMDAASQELAGKERSHFQDTLFKLTATTPSFGLAFAGYAMGQPELAMVAMGVIEAFPDYNNLREQGVSPEKAFATTMTSAAAVAATEMVGMDMFFKTMAKPLSSKWGRATLSFLQEGTQEASQQTIVNGINKLGGDKKRKLFDGIAESFLLGGLMGGIGQVSITTFIENTQAQLEKEGLSSEEANAVAEHTVAFLNTTAQNLMNKSSMFGEQRMVNLKGLEASQTRPGIETSAPLPDTVPTTKILEDLKGRDTVSKQFIQDLTNQPQIKQVERDMIRGILDEYEGGKINVTEFENKVRTALLPLEQSAPIREQMGGRSGGFQYEGIALPYDLRGDVADYSERVYQSPIKTSAGEVHFGSLKPSERAGYFAHTRIEDMTDDTLAGEEYRKMSTINTDFNRSMDEGDPEYLVTSLLEAEKSVSILSESERKELKKYESILDGEFENLSEEQYEDFTDDTIFFMRDIQTKINNKTIALRNKVNSTRRIIELQSDLFQKGRLKEEQENFGRNVFKFKENKDDTGGEIMERPGIREKVMELNKEELAPLEPYRNTWFERIIREEIKKAAQDGKQTVLFPTGETAMKIEGLGGEDTNWIVTNGDKLSVEDLLVGREVLDDAGGRPWIITEVSGDTGIFKAVPRVMKIIDPDTQTVKETQYLDADAKAKKFWRERQGEQFDIGGAINTSNPIYKFYEKTVAKYLNKEYGIKQITDEQGVTWNKVEMTPKLTDKVLKSPVMAFMRGPEGEASQRPGIEYAAPTNYETNYEINSPKRLSTPNVGGFTKAIGKIADKYLGTISTRLGNVNQSIKTKLRKMEFDTRMATKRDIEQAVPFLDKIKTLDKKDRSDFDLARKNGDTKKINELVKKYDMRTEYDNVRTMLDSVYKNMAEVGYKMGYKENYFPRMIKDTEGFLEFFRGSPDWPIIQQAIQAKEADLKRNLDNEEKAELINSLLRGFRSSVITLSDVGASKARTINEVTPELNKFYMDTDAALLAYVNAANESIHSRKFFGKGEMVTVDDSIGMYVLDLVQNEEITPSQEVELTQLLKARFNPKGPGKYMNVFKNLSYMGAMGSPSSAITQIGDLSFVLYKAGAVKTAKGIYKTISGQSKYTKESLGIEQMAQEFADNTRTGKAVTMVFRSIGLEAMDTFGKNNLINSVLDKYKADVISNDERALAKIDEIFGEEAGSVVEDLKSDTDSENIKFLAFYELSEMQPISLSEVPQGYLEGGNTRVMYMLKTYTIKLFDVYRNEVFQEIASGDPKRMIQGSKNLVRLVMALVTLNASADFLKDFLFGRNIDLEDLVVDNIFKLFGVNRYITWQARTEGIYSALTKQLLPPFSFVDNAGKDMYKMFTDPEQLREEGFESAQSIPLVGKLYYWWLGKGRAKSAKKQFGGDHKTWALKQKSKEEMLSGSEKQYMKDSIIKSMEAGSVTKEEKEKFVNDVKNNQVKLQESLGIIDKIKESDKSRAEIKEVLERKNEEGVITQDQVKFILSKT
jgi:hypothetical protein